MPDSEPDSPDSISSPRIKSAHRTKLSAQDIKLILYLIVQTKPFKYVGDRKISQTRKWELIQTRYEESKRDDMANGILKNVHDEVIVPTVRTLQRQLANAVRKAKERQHGAISPPYSFQDITRGSSMKELEFALLELHELSETLKSGKSFSHNSLSNNGEPFVHSKLSDLTRRDDLDSDRRTSNSSLTSSLLGPSIELEIALSKVNDTRTSLLAEIQNISGADRILPLVNSLIKYSTDYQMELDKIVDENMKLITRQTESLKELVSRNRAEVLKQSEINKDVLLKVIEEMAKTSSTQTQTPPAVLPPVSSFSSFNNNYSTSSDPIPRVRPIEQSRPDNKNRLLKSLDELLN